MQKKSKGKKNTFLILEATLCHARNDCGPNAERGVNVKKGSFVRETPKKEIDKESGIMSSIRCVYFA